VSLHERSELGDDDREREERRPCFSSDCSRSRAVSWDDGLPGRGRVRRGMLAGRREGFGDGMIAGEGLSSSSPICPMRDDGGTKEGSAPWTRMELIGRVISSTPAT
jgi:hypothetical protein